MLEIRFHHKSRDLGFANVQGGWLSLTLGGGGGGMVGDNGLVETGLTWETWMVGCTQRDGGS